MADQMTLSSAELLKGLVNYLEPIAPRISDKTVIVTGNDPLTEQELLALGRMLDTPIFSLSEFEMTMQAVDSLQDVDYIVIGRIEFDTTLLIHSLRFENVFEYITQEDFAELLVGKEFIPYVKRDSRIAQHPGLAYLSSIGFRWPSTSASPSSSPSISTTTTWSSESSLAVMSGYSVRNGISVVERRTALTRAVEVLDLKYVAEFIAWLARRDKCRHDSLMKDAIRKHEQDLSWLKSTYYESSSYRFIWPRT